MNDQATRPPRRTYGERREVVQRKFFQATVCAIHTVRESKMTHRQSPHHRVGIKSLTAGATVNEDSPPVPKVTRSSGMPLRRGRRRISLGYVTCGGSRQEFRTEASPGCTADWLSCVWLDLRERWGGNLADSSLIILPAIESESSKKPGLPAQPRPQRSTSRSGVRKSRRHWTLWGCNRDALR